MAEMDEREEELESIQAIYPELAIDQNNKFTASLDLAVSPSKPLYIRFKPFPTNETNGSDGLQANGATYAQTAAYVEHDVQFSHLPPLQLTVTLPEKYPAQAAPTVRLTAQSGWLPPNRLHGLEEDANKLWEEYGQCQILFAYIDHLQQAAERGFDLDREEAGCLVLHATAEPALASFDAETTLSLFNAGTYDCGICLEPKKGSSCFKLAKCGHIFCKQCLQDFYNNAITEGDVAGVRCLDPSCGKEEQNGRKRKRKTERTLHPKDLFAIGIEEAMVRRYVEMKRKKKLEADKTTVYCPRTWCQGAARSAKYPPIPPDLATYDMAESSSDESDAEGARLPATTKPPTADKAPPDPSDRLAVCEKCQLAFCRVCYMGWHGPFARCFPRDPNELSAEEKASYDYIRMNTSPCPTCSSPTQKTMGCNHMRCFQCNTHFCYLCGSWLDGQNPYQHFNKPGTECYQRLWELEEGDEGQAPEDGRGFVGARRWEQMAREAAREADEAEAAEARANAEANLVGVDGIRVAFDAGAPRVDLNLDQRRRGVGGRLLPHGLDELDLPDPPIGDSDSDDSDSDDDELVAAVAEMQLREQAAARQRQQRPPPPAAERPRRQRNPFPQHPPAGGGGGRGQAVRNYELRGRGGRGGGGGGGGRGRVHANLGGNAAHANIRVRARRGVEVDAHGGDEEEEGDNLHPGDDDGFD